ncbi:hypothetical protein Tco_0998901 [Tanacetum coccineum]
MLKKNDNESINDFAGNISGIVAKFKSLGLTLEEEVIVRNPILRKRLEELSYEASSSKVLKSKDSERGRRGREKRKRKRSWFKSGIFGAMIVKEAQTKKIETEKVQTETEGGNQERDLDRVLPEKERHMDIRMLLLKMRLMRRKTIPLKVRYIGAKRVQKARLQILRNELEMLKMNDNESINNFVGNISGIVAKFKSLGLTLEEEVIVRKFLNSVPNKYLPIVAPIEQYSDLETKPFEEAVGRVKAYEASHQNEEEDVEGTQREVEEAEEEEEVMVTKVEFGAMIVESVGTLAMSAQSGKTKIKPT